MTGRFSEKNVIQHEKKNSLDKGIEMIIISYVRQALVFHSTLPLDSEMCGRHLEGRPEEVSIF